MAKTSVVMFLSCLVTGINLSPARIEMFVSDNGSENLLNELWSSYVQRYNKTYDESEMYTRQQIWTDNLQFIRKHNLEADLGLHTFWLGETQFTDMTTAEFHDTMMIKSSGPLSRTDDNAYDMENVGSDNDDDPTHPRSLDWRKRGWVTAVKNQGRCSASWAFAATGALEGQYKNNTGKLITLSEQNLIDCAYRHYHNYGCYGGSPDNAFQYVEDNRGIANESCYKYNANKQRCEYKPWCKDAIDITYKKLTPMSTRGLKNALVHVGPVAMDINVPVRTQHFQHYRRGIYVDRRCQSRNPNHSLLVVGYGKQYGRRYWLLKNSYGTSWGENGYIRMAMNGNMCGILRYATYPIAQ